MRDARPYPRRSVREPSPKGPGARGYLQLHKFECPRVCCPEAPSAKWETKSLVFVLMRTRQAVVSIPQPALRGCWKFDWLRSSLIFKACSQLAGCEEVILSPSSLDVISPLFGS